MKDEPKEIGMFHGRGECPDCFESVFPLIGIPVGAPFSVELIVERGSG